MRNGVLAEGRLAVVPGTSAKQSFHDTSEDERISVRDHCPDVWTENRGCSKWNRPAVLPETNMLNPQ